MNHNIAVVIVTFCSRDLIAQCLQSVIDEDVTDIWVVDNASTDDTVDYVNTHFPQVNLIANAENIGFAAANNMAIRQIEGKDILFLNPDAWLTDGALAAMRQALEANQDVAMVGPRVIRQGEVEPTLLEAPRFFTSWMFILTGMRAMNTGGFAGKVVQGFPWRRVTEGEHIRGSCMLVRCKALEEVGLMNELFFLYFEETEWCLRFRQHDWKIVIEPKALAHHIGKASVGTQNALPSLEFMRSAVLFWKVNNTWVEHAFLRSTLFLMALTKCLLLLPFSAEKHRRGWLLNVAGLALNPFRMPIVYHQARRPSAWMK